MMMRIKIASSCLLGQPITARDSVILPAHGASHIIRAAIGWFMSGLVLNLDMRAFRWKEQTALTSRRYGVILPSTLILASIREVIAASFNFNTYKFLKVQFTL